MFFYCKQMFSRKDGYKDQQAVYEEAILEFTQRERAILEGVSFRSTLTFDINELLSTLHDKYIDKRKCRTIPLLRDRLSFQSLDEYVEWMRSLDSNLCDLDIFYDANSSDLYSFFLTQEPILRTAVSLPDAVVAE
jgi:hypothetical protein